MRTATATAAFNANVAGTSQSSDHLDWFYPSTSTCDTCDRHGKGVMFHAPDALGWLTPVFFQCKRCNPTQWRSTMAIFAARRSARQAELTRRDRRRLRNCGPALRPLRGFHADVMADVGPEDFHREEAV